MGGRNTEISVKGTFVPEFGPPDHFYDPEETSFGAAGLEVSGAYNVMGHLRKDSFLFLGPRLDLSVMSAHASRYRSNISLPVQDLEGFNERVDHPEYGKTQSVPGVGVFSIRPGVVVGTGPDTDLGIPVGLRLFVTAGPEGVEGYRVRAEESGKSDQEHLGTTSLGVKGGLEMLLVMKMQSEWDQAHGTYTDVGLVFGVAAMRTFNPITRESEVAPAFDFGMMVRF